MTSGFFCQGGSEDGEIQAYQDALAALRQHENAVRQTLVAIRKLVSDSEHGGWTAVVVDGVAMPAHLMAPHAPHFNPKSWLTGEVIGNLLATWHQLDNRHRALWDRVPKERRVGLSPPSTTRPT